MQASDKTDVDIKTKLHWRSEKKTSICIVGKKKIHKKPKAMDAAAKVRWIAYFAHTNNRAAKWLHMIAS